MPRRVLHILGDARYEGTGISRIVSSLARGIDPHDFEIHACFVGDSGPLVADFEKIGIPAKVISWRHPHRDPIGLLRLWWWLRNQQFDIVHLHWGGRGVRWAARRATDAKIVFHLHGRIDESMSHQPITISTERVDAVIAVSRAASSASSHPKTKVVYSGVDIPEHARYGATQELTIGTAGRLIPLKGVTYLLQAMAILRTEFPDLRLVIAGAGPEMSNLVSEADSLGLGDSVKFLGWKTDLPAVFAQWTIFVQPSLEEGLGIAVLEAMAAGLPVVASAVGGLPEIVDDGKTGMLVHPGNPAALANCLRDLLLNQAAAREMGIAGRNRIRQHFSSERMVDQISQIYDEVLR